MIDPFPMEDKVIQEEMLEIEGVATLNYRFVNSCRHIVALAFIMNSFYATFLCSVIYIYCINVIRPLRDS